MFKFFTFYVYCTCRHVIVKNKWFHYFIFHIRAVIFFVLFQQIEIRRRLITVLYYTYFLDFIVIQEALLSKANQRSEKRTTSRETNFGKR